MMRWTKNHPEEICVDFHDGDLNDPRGTLACRVRVNSVYQVERWVFDAAFDERFAHAGIIRIECPALGRTWTRPGPALGLKFCEKK